MSISSSSFDLEDTFINGKNGDIEGSTTKIEDKHVSLSGSSFVESVSDGSSGWFINDSLNGKTSNLSRILCSLSLCIVEIGRNSDNSVQDLLVKMSLSNFSHFPKDHSRDLLSAVFLSFALELNNDHWFIIISTLAHNLERPKLDVLLDSGVVEFPSDESFHIEYGVFGVSCSLVLSSLSDFSFFFGEGNI